MQCCLSLLYSSWVWVQIVSIYLHHDLLICGQIIHLLVRGKQQHRGAEVPCEGVLGRVSMQKWWLLGCLTAGTRTYDTLNEITHHEEQEQDQQSRQLTDHPFQIVQESVRRELTDGRGAAAAAVLGAASLVFSTLALCTTAHSLTGEAHKPRRNTQQYPCSHASTIKRFSEGAVCYSLTQNIIRGISFLILSFHTAHCSNGCLEIRVLPLTYWKWKWQINVIKSLSSCHEVMSLSFCQFRPTVAHNWHPQNGAGDLRSHLIKNAWHCFSVGFNGPIIARTNSN